MSSFVSPQAYKQRWADAGGPLDHELVTDHPHCAGFWPECTQQPRRGVTREDVYTAGVTIGGIITEAREAQIYMEPAVVNRIMAVVQALEDQAG